MEKKVTLTTLVDSETPLIVILLKRLNSHMVLVIKEIKFWR